MLSSKSLNDLLLSLNPVRLLRMYLNNIRYRVENPANIIPAMHSQGTAWTMAKDMMSEVAL